MKLPRFLATNEVSAQVPSGTRLPLQTFQPGRDAAAEVSAARGLQQTGEQLGRFGSQIEDVAIRKQAANNESEALSLYTRAVKQYDEFYANAKAVPDPETGHKTFAADANAQLQSIKSNVAKTASSKVVEGMFLKKMAAFDVERYSDALRFQDALFRNYHEGVLNDFLHAQKNLVVTAPDEYTARTAIQQGSAEISRLKGVLPADTVSRLHNNFTETTGSIIARQSMERDPKAFIAGGYKRYQGLANPDLLQKMVDEAAPRLIEHLDNMQNKVRKEREDDYAKALKDGADAYVTETFGRFDPSTPIDQRPNPREVEARLAVFHSEIPVDVQRRLRDLANAPATTGVSTPGLKDSLNIGILVDDPTITKYSILARSDLSVGDKKDLVSAVDERAKADDVSKNPHYKHGRDLIHTVIGGVSPEAAFLGAIMRPGDEVKLAQALYMFEKRARNPQTKPEQLPDIAVSIIKQFRPDYTATPQAASAGPKGQGTKQQQQPVTEKPVEKLPEKPLLEQMRDFFFGLLPLPTGDPTTSAPASAPSAAPRSQTLPTSPENFPSPPEVDRNPIPVPEKPAVIPRRSTPKTEKPAVKPAPKPAPEKAPTPEPFNPPRVEPERSKKPGPGLFNRRK